MLAPAGRWCHATVVAVSHPAPHAVILRLRVRDRTPHLAGQHYVIRLTAEDGYTAARSYSVSSAPEDEDLEFYIEELPDGEVSSYLAESVEVGDVLELRGPIGGWFVWDGAAPAVGIGGGTGVAPLVAMLRHARRRETTRQLRLAAAARTSADLPYADELRAFGATLVLSREGATAGRRAGRLTGTDLAPLLTPDATYYVCGSAGFAEATSELLVSAGVAPGAVRVERFGPTG